MEDPWRTLSCADRPWSLWIIVSESAWVPLRLDVVNDDVSKPNISSPFKCILSELKYSVSMFIRSSRASNRSRQIVPSSGHIQPSPSRIQPLSAHISTSSSHSPPLQSHILPNKPHILPFIRHIRPIHSKAPIMSSVVNAVKSTIAENTGGPSHSLAPKKHQFSLDEVPDLSGKVAVVTGGSEGIGYACTHTLLSRNVAHLHILSVSQEVVDGALDAIRKEMGDDAAKRVTWHRCDLSDWKQTQEVAEKIAKVEDRLDILIENAARGIMTYQLTDYGVDRHMALNHMGHVLLTARLLPLLKKTAEAGNTVRVAIVASNAHEFAPSSTKFESLDELNQDLGPNGQYGRSKLAAILYVRYLTRHLTAAQPKILANATHPGFVDTKMSAQDIHEPYPLGGYAMSVGMAPLKKDKFLGAVSTLFAATTTEKSGEYICPPAIPEPGSKLAQDEALGEQLQKLTREILEEQGFSIEPLQQGS